MLERNVQINGTVYDRHELVMVTLQPGRDAIATVRSSRSDVDDDLMVETSHECELGGEADFPTWEETVWALPEFEEWTDAAAGLDEVLSLLTDEQAETVTALYPEWKAGVSYSVGDRRRYDGLLYRCVQAHASQDGWEPPSVPALWVRTASEGEVPEWVQPTGAQDAYNVGDRVTHNGQTWTSDVDGNVWEPGVHGWSEA